MAFRRNLVVHGVASEAILSGGAKTTLMSMVSSVGAVLAACSCCILPMALAGAGLSTGLGSVLSPLGSLRWPMVGLSVLMLAVSWTIVIRQRWQGCRCGPSHIGIWLRTPKVLMLVVASLLTLVSLSWGAFEPALMKAML